MQQRPDVATYSHSNPVTAKGFMVTPNVVVLNTKLSIGARFLYGYLSHLAWRARSGGIEPTFSSMCSDLGISEPTVRGYLRELDGGGLVTTVRRGRTLPNAYVVHDAVTEEDLRSLRKDLSVPARAGSLLEEEVEPKTSPPIVPPRPENRPAAVARKPVTDLEYDRAVTALDHFNRSAGTRYTSRDWIAKIVARIREHPELPAEAHAVVIDRVLAEPWWDGDPSPSVIYGNAGIFERSVHSVRTAPKPKSLTGDDIRKLRG